MSPPILFSKPFESTSVFVKLTDAQRQAVQIAISRQGVTQFVDSILSHLESMDENWSPIAPATQTMTFDVGLSPRELDRLEALNLPYTHSVLLTSAIVENV